jgi:hypothetical protein
MAGQLMYDNFVLGNSMQIARGSEFKPGIYLIRVLDQNKQAYHRKLIFK